MHGRPAGHAGNPAPHVVEMGDDAKPGHHAEAGARLAGEVSQVRYPGGQRHRPCAASRQGGSGPPRVVDGGPHAGSLERVREVGGAAPGEIDETGTGDQLGVASILSPITVENHDRDRLDPQPCRLLGSERDPPRDGGGSFPTGRRWQLHILRCPARDQRRLELEHRREILPAADQSHRSGLRHSAHPPS